MRRVLALAVLTAALFTAAACGNSNTPGGTATSAPAGNGASAGDNTAEVCAAAKKTIEDSTRKLAEELTKALMAQSSGDAAAGAAAIQSLQALFTSTISSARTEAARATNAELKQALTTFADESEKAIANVKTPADLEKIDQLDTAALTAAQEKVDQICA